MEDATSCSALEIFFIFIFPYNIHPSLTIFLDALWHLFRLVFVFTWLICGSILISVYSSLRRIVHLSYLLVLRTCCRVRYEANNDGL